MTCLYSHIQQQCCPNDERVKQVQWCLHKLSHNSDARRQVATTVPAKCVNRRHISFRVSNTHTSHYSAQAISHLVLLRATRVQSRWTGVGFMVARQFPFNQNTSIAIRSGQVVPHSIMERQLPLNRSTWASIHLGLVIPPFNRGTSVTVQSEHFIFHSFEARQFPISRSTSILIRPEQVIPHSIGALQLPFNRSTSSSIHLGHVSYQSIGSSHLTKCSVPSIWHLDRLQLAGIQSHVALRLEI
jgi:hypothetical protein